MQTGLCLRSCMCMLISLEYCHVIKNPFQPWDLPRNSDACVYAHIVVRTQLPLILPAAYIGVGYIALSMLKDWVEI
jgi:hypothetical protein